MNQPTKLIYLPFVWPTQLVRLHVRADDRSSTPGADKVKYEAISTQGGLLLIIADVNHACNALVS